MVKTDKIIYKAEQIVDKSLDIHKSTWKDKHNAKMEKMKLKHEQKMENKEFNSKKKNIVQNIFDGINDKEQLKLEDERIKREEEEKSKEIVERRKIGKYLFIIGIILTFIASLLMIKLPELNSIRILGIITFIVGLVMLSKKNKEK